MTKAPSVKRRGVFFLGILSFIFNRRQPTYTLRGGDYRCDWGRRRSH